jgi:molybdopterin-guanine dinucleotide biosynthesis protein A
VAGRRIIDRVVDALRPVTSQVVLASNAPDATRWLPGVRAIPDVRSERGSLVGIHTALAHAGPDDVLVVAWDMPFVTDRLLQLICDCAHHTTFAAVPEGPTGLEPLCAVYRPSALPFIVGAIEAGDLRMTNLLDRLPSFEKISPAAIATVGDPARLFFNVNSADDLAAAERMAAASLEV